MSDEEKFDWNLLANTAASAANLLRAFEYAEQVFKSISKAESVLQGSAEVFNELQEKTKELSEEKQSLIDTTKATQDALIAQRVQEMDTLHAKNEAAKTVQEHTLQNLAKLVDVKSAVLETLKAEHETLVKSYAKQISEWEQKLTDAKTKYQGFMASLPQGG